MIRELLEQRTSDYNEMTKKIIGLYENKLIKALRFYIKTDRVIQIETINFYEANHNFVICAFSTALITGDKIKLPDGTIVEIDENSLDKYITESTKLVMSITALETYNAIQLFELLKKMDIYIKQYGANTYQKGLESGIIRFEDLLETSDYSHIYDSVENPLESILEDLDELQKLEYEIYSGELKNNRVLH